ncbi:DUF2157 domain-containing protein [Alkalihalobacillus sp. TS-13]|uniref:DUF2157 domain-containing protein n=1 Tax=Alkalihalobacillus sp. TS-13 TaxID=2842455 RepID=UPI001C87FA49|nr:DUF2157 domain-containing protein [Alkalihalobacillus sp. TS-13]
MNERRWLKKEGPKWIEKGLIEKEQLDGILSLYEKKNNNLLPILASILIGLGVLTFVASNWGNMSDLFRLVIICAALTGFQLSGYRLIEKGSETLGIALVGIGVITFGAGIFLTAQMFHIVSYTATAFILWMVVALLTYAILPNSYIYLLSLVIGVSGMIYSAISFQGFSFVLAFLILFAAGYLTFKENHPLFYYIYTIAYSITGITLLVDYDLTYLWMTIIFFILYGISELIPGEKGQLAFRNMSIIGSLAVIFIHVFFLDELVRYEGDVIGSGALYFIMLIGLSALIAWNKFRQSTHSNWLDLALFLPLFLISEIGDLLYLLLAFSYSLFILIQGYQLEESERINRGTFLFLISTLVAYIQLAWDFLPKSMFFLAGGVLLFILSWLLERRRRKWAHQAKGGRS